MTVAELVADRQRLLGERDRPVVLPRAPQREREVVERGRVGLSASRFELCRLLWRMWSPSWRFSDATYAATAKSFDNADFVDVVIHSYRHRFGYVAGDPVFDDLETKLAEQPPISVPTIALYGLDDGVTPPIVSGSGPPAQRFTGAYERRDLPGVGHNPPQENPGAFVAAVLDVLNAG